MLSRSDKPAETHRLEQLVEEVTQIMRDAKADGIDGATLLEGAIKAEEAPAGWQVTIAIPQPNGRVGHHVWVLAIPDESEVREKLLLSELPTEFEAHPLSHADLTKLSLGPGEVRRLE